MRWLLVAPLLLGTLASFAQGSWIQRSSLTVGAARWGCAEFVIDGVGYVVGGRAGSSDLNELRAYNAASDTWEARASLPGSVRRLASAFAIGGKGYVTCGLYNTSSMLNDLWEYDPVTNGWTQKASLPSGARYSAAAFSLNGLGYVFGGNLGSATGPFSAELWAYDPLTNSWSSRASLPGQARFAAKAFVTDGKGYVFGGRRADITFSNELWAYDPGTNSWNSRTPLPSLARSYSFVWSLAERGIVMGGDDPDFSDLQDCWSYDPFSNAWSPLAPYTGNANWGGTSLVINDRIYAGLGRFGTNMAADLWELREPFVGMTELGSSKLTIAPNPVSSAGVLSVVQSANTTGTSVEFTLRNAQGQLVFQKGLTNAPSHSIALPVLPIGNYIAGISGDGVQEHRTVITVGD